MMLLVNVLAQRFRAVPARSDAGQGLHKTAVAHPALIAPASHPQSRRPTTKVEVPHLTLIPAFAVEPAGSTAKAGLRLLHRLHFDHDLRLQHPSQGPIPLHR
jgi:hypothetical protein